MTYYLTIIDFHLRIQLLYFLSCKFDDRIPIERITNQQPISPVAYIIRLTLITALVLVGSRVEAKPIEFVFTCWGTPFERQVVKKVLQQFNQQDPNVRVRPQHIHIPNSNYIRPS